MAGIDTTATKNSLFGGLKAEVKPLEVISELKQAPEEKLILVKRKELDPKIKNEQVKKNNPKWLSLDKVTVLLTTDQKDGLDRVAKKIMKRRSKQLKVSDNKERITTNTLIRALVNHFLEIEESFESEVLLSEQDVQKWIKNAFAGQRINC